MNDLAVLPYIFDLELSGKCNTWCSFCPREEMKRGENFMSDENFEHFMRSFSQYASFLSNQIVFLPTENGSARLGEREESPLRVIMCGMGESLMHKNCVEWVERIRREVGARVTIVTNGLLLKEKTAERLAAAGLTVALVSVPGIDEETYSRYMKIDWNRVLRNIEAAEKIMPGRVHINATIPDDAPFGPEEVLAFWGERGITVSGISRCHNRGGFLADATLTGRFGKSKSMFCGILARHNFVAWDGRILSCCHDLHAEATLGKLSDTNFIELALRKTPIVQAGPRYSICRNCNDSERCHAGQILSMPVVQISKRQTAISVP